MEVKVEEGKEKRETDRGEKDRQKGQQLTMMDVIILVLFTALS